MPNLTPEQQAREQIDAQLKAACWAVQSLNALNLGASFGVAVREFPLTTGKADYLLFVDRKAVGVIEAKKVGSTLSHVEEQSGKYTVGLPSDIPHVELPLPFAYESTGIETHFRDNRDPTPRSRRIFSFHKPETFLEWANQPDTLRARLQNMPPLIPEGLWRPQVEAVTNLEESFAEDRPRALIQMATGSGKTFTACTFVYRLIKFAGAKRVLFLVDRNSLGKGERVADEIVRWLPDAEVWGWTGLAGPKWGLWGESVGRPNNGYFARRWGPMPKVPKKSEWVELGDEKK